MPPLGPDLHGRKGPGGEEAGRGQATAQAVTRFPRKSLRRHHQGLGVRDGAVTMAGPELSPVPSNWLLVVLMLLSGTAPSTRPAGFPLSLCSHWVCPLSLHPPVSHFLPPISSRRPPWGLGLRGPARPTGPGVHGPSPSPACRCAVELGLWVGGSDCGRARPRRKKGVWFTH